MTNRFLQTPSSPTDAPEQEPRDERSAFVQALPLLLSVAATLALTLAFVVGQWLASGSTGLA